MITFRVFPHNVSEEGQGQLCVGPIEQALQLWPGHEVTETADVHPHLLQSVRLCRGGGGGGGTSMWEWSMHQWTHVYVLLQKKLLIAKIGSHGNLPLPHKQHSIDVALSYGVLTVKQS